MSMLTMGMVGGSRIGAGGRAGLCVAAAVLSVVMVVGWSSPAWAQSGAGDEEVSPQVRATFTRLVTERNHLHRQLRQLDRQAAEAVKRGEDPVTLHAQQVASQDKLDLVNARLEMLAARHGLEVPSLPRDRVLDDGSVSDVDPEVEAQIERAANRAFDRGRQRTLEELRRQTMAMLASLNLNAYLDE